MDATQKDFQPDYSRLDGAGWAELLSAHPELADKCDWAKLNGYQWAELLAKQPQFADKCDWRMLNSDEKSYLCRYCPPMRDRIPRWTPGKESGAAIIRRPADPHLHDPPAWVLEEKDKLLAEAKEKLKAKEYLNVLALCKKASRLCGFCAEFVWLEGLAHLELGTLESEWDHNDTIAACRCFECLAENDSGRRAEACLYNGLATLRWGNNYRIAIENFDKVLELDPENVLAIRLREVCRKCVNWDKSESMALLTKASDLDGGEERNRLLNEFYRKSAEETAEAQNELDAILKDIGADYRIHLSSNQIGPCLQYLD